MKILLCSFVFVYIAITTCQAQTFATNAKINPRDLKCLVCEKSIIELTKKVNTLDPNIKVEVGGHRLDKDGNFKQKEVPQDKSEVVLSEIIETICDKMDDYVRAIWKSNGTLTLLPLVESMGLFDKVDLVQDDDLNKSLKFYCEEIMEEHEETVIDLLQKETSNLDSVFCVDNSKLCKKKKNKTEL